MPEYAGSREGAKYLHPAHTPALNTFLIVHAGRLLAQAGERDFQTGKTFVFPLKMPKISLSLRRGALPRF